MKKILITGANGFIAHHMAEYFSNKKYDVYANYRRNTYRIKNIVVKPVQFDLNDIIYPDMPKFDYIIHTAANTWVDGSLHDVMPYIENNVMATGRFLEWVKKEQPQSRLCLFSSNEVLGPAKEGEYFKEESLYKPSNPYAATKVSQEMLVYAFAHSFDLDMFTIRCMNVIGEREDEKKFIGKTIKAIRNNEKIIIHGTDKDNVASRHWIYAKDVAYIMEGLLKRANRKEVYHISGEEVDVYTFASKLFKLINKRDMLETDVEFVDFHKARKGHDKRYSLSNQKIRDMGFNQFTPIDEVIKKLVK